VELQPGRVAVVTGAASGIGLELSRAFAAAGLQVVMSDVQPDRLHEAVASVEGKAEAVVADVGNLDDIGRISDAAWALGSVQVLCSNAGIVRGGPAWSIPAADWQRVIDVNLMASVHLIRTFVPRLIDAGDPPHLLITGSMGSVTVRPGNAPYGVAKHGLLALAETTHLDLAAAGHPIGVTLFLPGLVATQMTGSFAAGNPDAITAEDAAEVALRAIVEDRLFAFSQPDRLDGVRQRFAAITGE